MLSFWRSLFPLFQAFMFDSERQNVGVPVVPFSGELCQEHCGCGNQIPSEMRSVLGGSFQWMYKPFRPFVKGTTPVRGRGLTNHGY